MNQLNNDRYWKEFKLPDLEINSYGTPTLHLRQVEAASEIDPDCETINYITRGKFNNGVKLRVIKKPNFNIIPKNTISFGGETGEFFYQREPYVTGRDVYYIDTSKLTENEALFLLTIVRKKLHTQSTFNTIMTASIVNNTPFQLPVNEQNKPDWQYMNLYINELRQRALEKLNIINNINIQPTSINSQNWENFKFTELFTVNNSTNVLRREVDFGSGSMPYITASSMNNGVVSYIDASNLPVDEGNCLLIGGKTYSISYQRQNFVSNDSHNLIIRLKPEYKQYASENVYLFLASIFRAYSYYYNWANAVNKNKLKSSTLHLPIIQKGVPDWQYMNQFIDQKKSQVKDKIEAFGKI